MYYSNKKANASSELPGNFSTYLNPGPRHDVILALLYTILKNKFYKPTDEFELIILHIAQTNFHF